MALRDLHQIDTWVFDLDHTLYPPNGHLFEQIEIRMQNYVAQFLGISPAEAKVICATYWRDHGTTLAGLMDIHGMAPDHFLQDVHDIDFGVLDPDPGLAAAIAALPGRKIIYTNGTAPYAHNVICARELDGLFDAIYGVEHANYRSKPEAAAFNTIFAKDGLDPSRSAMFEDSVRNLEVPFALGMRTIHVSPTKVDAKHIEHSTADLTAFLSQLAPLANRTTKANFKV